jgi:hypothetical protein
MSLKYFIKEKLKMRNLIKKIKDKNMEVPVIVSCVSLALVLINLLASLIIFAIIMGDDIGTNFAITIVTMPFLAMVNYIGFIVLLILNTIVWCVFFFQKSRKFSSEFDSQEQEANMKFVEEFRTDLYAKFEERGIKVGELPAGLNNFSFDKSVQVETKDQCIQQIIQIIIGYNFHNANIQLKNINGKYYLFQINCF